MIANIETEGDRIQAFQKQIRQLENELSRVKAVRETYRAALLRIKSGYPGPREVAREALEA